MTETSVVLSNTRLSPQSSITNSVPVHHFTSYTRNENCLLFRQLIPCTNTVLAISIPQASPGSDEGLPDTCRTQNMAHILNVLNPETSCTTVFVFHNNTKSTKCNVGLTLNAYNLHQRKSHILTKISPIECWYVRRILDRTAKNVFF